MVRPGFLDDNVARSYPFIVGREADVPDCIIADFGSTALEGSGYIEGTHEVWLEWIRRLGSVIEFSFRSDAPGLANQSLIFQRDITDPEFVTSFSWAQTALTQAQLDAACECGPNVVCNPAFDELPGSSYSLSSSSLDTCDKYPGSAVYGWNVAAGITQTSDVMRIVVPALGTKEAYQEIGNFIAGQQVRVFFDLVANDGSADSFVVAEIAGPTQGAVLSTISVKDAGTYELTATVPAGGVVFINFRVFNAHTTNVMTVDIDDVSMQSCISQSSSYTAEEPEPEVCPTDAVWEGFLVTGDIDCILDELKDCTRVGNTVGGEGDVDVLFLTDTTGSMASYISTIKAVFSPLATSVSAMLPEVVFNWAAVSYKDFEDGGNYANGYQIDQAFTPTIATVQTAINSWSASGGGDLPEQQIAALKLVADNWETTLSGRANSQRVVVWGGDVGGHEDGAKSQAYPALPDTVAALVAAGIKVFAINSKAAGDGLDDVGTPSGERQASTITSATGGQLSNSVSQSDADAIAAIVANGIFTTTTTTVAVTIDSIDGPAYVEPTRTKNLNGAYVRSFAVANADRTRATTADGCRDLCWPFDLQDHYVACECVASDVRFTAGYNTNLRVEPDNNAVIIDAEVGAGSFDCTDVAVFPGESAPGGLTTLDGGLKCNEVVRTINGVGSQFFEIRGGQGVTVTPIPDQHRIIIGVDLGDLALCPDLADAEPVECFAPSVDPCVCGPEDLGSFSCPTGATTAAPLSIESTPGCGDPCTWVWTHPAGDPAGAWVKVTDACADGCACSEPVADGSFIGEIQESPCLTTTGACGLLNSNFEIHVTNGAGEVTSLLGWTIEKGPGTGEGDLWIANGGFSLMPITQQDWVLRLAANTSGDTRIEQDFTATCRTVTVTAYVSEVQGDSSWGLLNGTTVLVPTSITSAPGAPGDAGAFISKRYTVVAGSTLTVYFEADNALTFSGRGILDVASVCVVEEDCGTTTTTTSTTTTAPPTTTSTTTTAPPTTTTTAPPTTTTTTTPAPTTTTTTTTPAPTTTSTTTTTTAAPTTTTTSTTTTTTPAPTTTSTTTTTTAAPMTTTTSTTTTTTAAPGTTTTTTAAPPPPTTTSTTGGP